MTKQPTLTGFPRAIFATARRRLQATLRSARERAIKQSLCGYSLLFSPVLSGQFLASCDPTLRQRHFGHVPVFWAWMAQILEANASCSKALGLIQAWYRSSDLPVPRGDTSGYCSARSRLDEGFLIAIFEKGKWDQCANLNKMFQLAESQDPWIKARIPGDSLDWIFS